MAGLRGICSSPLSSADEADAPSSGFPDFSPSPESRSARRKTNVPLKRQETSAKRKKKASTMSSRPVKKQKPQGDAKSTKELVHEAPLEFVEFLADQLSGVQQAKYEKEFGTAQGFVIRLPPSSWKTKHKRSELSEWVQSLGFTSAATLRRYTLRVASRKAEIILHELCHRVPSIGEDDMENEVASQTEDIIERNDASGDAGEKERTPSEDYLNDPALVRLKEYFRKLESQELEVLSYSENHKLLSSTRHMAIADAMEDVLAQPSVRRDRRLARRLSKLGRISGRRISSIPLVPSTILPPVEDDWVWDQEMEKMSLTPVKRRISLGDSSVTQKLNILGEGVLQLVLHSGLVDVVTLKGVIRKVSTMWKNIAIV
ncbi:hypothetical protein PHYBOEH_007740 [Phytophthora boehmeriae]|uniref:Uncharacterized protein n=1 Tax=Phytophthora boehmeriae TaxID=109152 RepID=A0A8T1X7T0_9STRA|nr:hypothetical protein PHYBOEH_007740 [Phytophthora boehmeriae]